MGSQMNTSFFVECLYNLNMENFIVMFLLVVFPWKVKLLEIACDWGDMVN